MERDAARCAREGMAMLFISSELSEVLRVPATASWCCATAARWPSCRPASSTKHGVLRIDRRARRRR